MDIYIDTRCRHPRKTLYTHFLKPLYTEVRRGRCFYVFCL